MKNIEYLAKLLQKNSKSRMILMYAVSDNLKEAIAIQGTDEYATDLLSAAVSSNETLRLSKDTKEKCASVISEALENVDIGGIHYKKDRLIAIEKQLKASITDEVKTTLKEIPTNLEIDGINKLPVETVDSIVLWMMVRDVISEIPVCEVTMKTAASYRQQKPKKKEVKNMSSDDIQHMLESFSTSKYQRTDYQHLSKNEKNTLTGIIEIIRKDAEEAESVIKAFDGGLSEEQESVAVEISATLEKKVKLPHSLSLSRDYVIGQKKPTAEGALIPILYSEFCIAAWDVIKEATTKEEKLYDLIRCPGFSSLIMSTDASLVKVDDAIKEYQHLMTMREVKEEEDLNKNEIIPIGVVIDETIVEEPVVKKEVHKFFKKLKRNKKSKEKPDFSPLEGDDSLIKSATGKRLSEMTREEKDALIRQEKSSVSPCGFKIMLLDGTLC